MEYALENVGEVERLEFQARLANYSLEEELKSLQIKRGSKVLDAGCGSGLLSRYLIDHFDGVEVFACDFSSTRIVQAKELAARRPYSLIQFKQGNLESLPYPDGGFDQVICRFVFEHLKDPQKVAHEFHRVLRPKGLVCLIDLDGILYNLYSSNVELQGMLDQLRRGWKTDLNIGRKLPSLLKQAGFKIHQWDLQNMQFHGRALMDELELTRQRLDFVKPVLLDILGSAEKVSYFSDLYCNEMQSEEATLFYNKFIVYAEK